jgi:hypothetical protein
MLLIRTMSNYEAVFKTEDQGLSVLNLCLGKSKCPYMEIKLRDESVFFILLKLKKEPFKTD